MDKDLGKNDFFYLTLEFNLNVLDLRKEQGFFHYDYLDSFEKFKESLLRKDKFHNTLTNRPINDKNYEIIFLMFRSLLK